MPRGRPRAIKNAKAQHYVLSDAQASHVKERAARSGMSASAYVRMLIDADMKRTRITCNGKH